jgi:hypothetical protein
MTYSGKSFEADENRERWLDEEIETEKKILEDDEEVKKIIDRLKVSSEKGENFLKENNLTEDDIRSGKRIFGSDLE